MEGEGDIQFLPFLDFMGRAKLLSEPLEIGGKIKARCRDSGMKFTYYVWNNCKNILINAAQDTSWTPSGWCWSLASQ